MGRFFVRFKPFFTMKRYYPIHIFWIRLDFFYQLPFKKGLPRAMCWFVMPFWLDQYNHYLSLFFLNSVSKQLIDAYPLVFYLANIAKFYKFIIFFTVSVIYYPLLLKFSIFVILWAFRIYDYISSYLQYIALRDWHIFNSKWYSDWILLRPFRNRKLQAILLYSKFVVFMLLTFDKHKNMDNK